MEKLYALLLSLFLSSPLFPQTSQPVFFESGAILFPDNFGEERRNPSVSASEIVNGRYARYVQCTQIPTASERALLEAEGVQFIDYVRFGAYLVLLPQHFEIGNLETIHARSIMPVQSTWKIARNLREQPYGAWALHGDWLDVNLQVYPHISIPQGAEWCVREGMTILLEGNQNGFLQVRLLKEDIKTVAALPWVRGIELVPPPSEPDDTRGRSLHRSNGLDSDHALGKKYNGEGVSILVRDDGPIGPHIDFQGRLFNITEPGSNGNHGDGVGGIFAGAGNLNPTMKGMAAGATVYAIRYTPEFQDQTLPLHLNQNVTITNTSYSNGCNAGYTLAAQTVDKQIFENPTLMHVFSAGNSNNISTCTSYGAGNQWGNITGGHKMAKNAIATANLFADASLEISSSRGPAHDGRLKPDISANGQLQESTDHNHTYMTFGGTSGAAPGIAGCLAQLTHAYKSLNGGQEPEAALLKTAILNTANDLGNVGPDFKFGWGHVNAARALRLLEEEHYLHGQTDHGQQQTFSLQIPTNVRQVRIMAYWADPPAATNAAVALLNDLDLRVVAPNGNLHLPWKLDPTPVPFYLDQPATQGRDSLNNTEQVSIDNPLPGTYSVRIVGTEVPFGPQRFVLAWEFLTDDIRITYPIGGEAFVPGEIERIHWDAFGEHGVFSLRYSTDNGFSWKQIADVPGNLRMFDWEVPNIVNGKIKLLIQRGLVSHVTEFPLTIAPLVSNIQIEKVCPDSMVVKWTPANDTLSSQIYLLGNKYMEIVGSTASNAFTIPLQNGGKEQWASVRAIGSNGLAGRRATAVQWPGELKNCVQPNDLAVRFIESPSGEREIRCSPFVLPVTVLLKNEGSNPVVGATLHYQASNKLPISQSVPNMSPGQILLFSFQTPLLIAENGDIDLKVWSTYALENAFFNDTLRMSFQAAANPLNNYFTEGFQDFNFPPFGWRVINPDGNFTWTRTSQNVTGSNGFPTRAVVLNCFSYLTMNEQDYLDLIPVDLSNLNSPSIAFDLAHARRSNRVERLRVEVFPACNLSAPPVVVWEKSDPELSTAGALTTSFVPTKASDWRREVADLSQFVGQKVIVRFASTNGAGNNIYLDNIGVVEYNVSQPKASFAASADSLCIGDTIVYVANQTGGDFTNYQWYFGQLASPLTAVGVGPHAVRYISSGDKNVRLITSNIIGTDTIINTIKVSADPMPSFWVQQDGLKMTFTNTSQHAVTFSWDFGDGNGSTATNPVHTYAQNGVYSVQLAATNHCRTAQTTSEVSTTLGLGDLSSRYGIRIYPNPTPGDFQVEIESPAAIPDAMFGLFDSQGRLIKEMGMSLNAGRNAIPFEDLRLPKGVYQLNMQLAGEWQGFKIVVQ
ncbi:MAG: S8 family serine peptidase [Saprospiraceae bacterium]|nr:S8 family serine peptidase [Saprospiraceae bacterium]